MRNFLAAILLYTTSLTASDLGTYGNTFEIHEQDFLVVLQERLSSMRTDNIGKEQVEKKLLSKIETPKGRILPKAKELRTFEFDPTVILKDDIRDLDGKIIANKGDKINPLNTTTLNENLLIFDGTDKKQLEWASLQQGKWIISNGRPLELERKRCEAVYFDQAGFMTTKLGISALPARVSQQGNMLLVKEIPCL